MSPGRQYQGDFVAWTGGCLFIGSGSGTIATHAHYAIQIAMGHPDGLKVQVGTRGAWQPCAAAIIPSRASHTIDVAACEWNIVLFVEPETPEGRILAKRVKGSHEILPSSAVAAFAKRLHHAWKTEVDAEQVASACRDFVRELTHVAPREPSDERILAAIEYIRAHMDEPMTLADVAGACHLSPGRFRHLFVAETGMPMRTYLVWRRFLLVWALLMEGHSLSSAAQLAGFSDSAHLSRTSRTVFGLAPSAMQMNGPLSQRLRTGVTRSRAPKRRSGGSTRAA